MLQEILAELIDVHRLVVRVHIIVVKSTLRYEVDNMQVFVQTHHRTVHPRLVLCHQRQIGIGIFENHREETVAENQVALYQQRVVLLQLVLYDGQRIDVVRLVDYVFLGTCKGFLNHQEQLRVEPVTESEEYVLQFPLASITAPVLIENIFYDFDKATLRPESTAALDKLVTLLNENANVTIELSAHCDYKGSAEYNKGLAQRRAEAVVEYLTAHGIPEDRLKPVGYGKEKPKTIRRKLTEKYPFLKEGDVLTEEFIKKLDEEQQEICNQLNRRTEFIVLRTTYGLFPKK